MTAKIWMVLYSMLALSCHANRKNTANNDTVVTQSLTRHTCDNDTDCTNGQCTTFHANRVCEQSASPWMHSCDSTLDTPSECCSDSECLEGEGACIAVEMDYCGGAMPPEENVCAYDACQADSDCGVNQVCIQANMMGNVKNQCIDASCRSDSDCTGTQQCNLIWSDAMCPTFTLSCVNDDAMCRTTTDCNLGDYCVRNENASGGAACEALSPPP